MPGLVDLPNEILVTIFEDRTFPTDTLYALALLSRRLHFIALPIFLSRHGVTTDSKTVDIQMEADRRDLLAALNIALFALQPEAITCALPHPSCTSIFPLIPHIDRLTNYFSRLPSVQHVTLVLDSSGGTCLAVGDDRALRAWSIHLGRLLNCIVKKQCSSFTIQNGGQFTKTYEVDTKTGRRGSLNLSSILPKIEFGRRVSLNLSSVLPKLLLQGKNSETQAFRRAPHQGLDRIEMSSCYSSSHLTSLDIRSAALILPPGLSWTLTALRNCGIKSLTLGRGIKDAGIWGTVLPLIASAGRSLTSLTLTEFDPGSISDNDILAFIARLPQLRHLSISSGTTRTKIPEAAGPLIPLRALETLRAPPAFIEYFLRHRSPLPKITSICVLWARVYISSDVSALVVSLRTTLRKLDAHGLTPLLAVAADTLTHSPRGLAYYRSTPRLIAFVDRVEVLEITATPFFYGDTVDVASWVALFRRARRVELTVSNPEKFDVEGLLRAIEPTEGLDGICVNGKMYALAKEGKSAVDL
ncbi:hypothetical protein C8R45DRAFT_1023399 [Mycena sanguinolenta]|nr:hypothetical protein C8R45DRAFT_1023399 [Mycena sanguinolenta]